MTPAEALAEAVQDERLVARYKSFIRADPASGCWLWTGAISGQGHGRFWLGRGRVVIAHRMAWALAHQGEQLPLVVRHECDNPLCQNPRHLRAGSHGENRSDYFARYGTPGSPLNDLRGARGRARALRDAARAGDDTAHAEQVGQSMLDLYQDPLW